MKRDQRHGNERAGCVGMWEFVSADKGNPKVQWEMPPK